jgi:hypothetical protein
MAIVNLFETFGKMHLTGEYNFSRMSKCYLLKTFKTWLIHGPEVSVPSLAGLFLLTC